MLEYVPLGEFKVTYLDGETQIARANFGAIMELEAAYIGDGKVPQATVLVRAMWLYLDRPKDSLEAWAATVHNIEPHKVDVGTDPSPPAVGDG